MMKCKICKTSIDMDKTDKLYFNDHGEPHAICPKCKTLVKLPYEHVFQPAVESDAINRRLYEKL